MTVIVSGVYKQGKIELLEKSVGLREGLAMFRFYGDFHRDQTVVEENEACHRERDMPRGLLGDPSGIRDVRPVCVDARQW